MKKQPDKTDLVIQATSSEGLGSQYERVQLITLLPKIIDGLKIQTILETPASITKGWDNVHFGKDKAITVSNEKNLSSIYPYQPKPSFITPSQLNFEQYDLVWNFAVFHQKPEILETMMNHSKKYILIFTPNVLNWGAPLHWGYHLFSKTKCFHPEKGNFNLMTLWGLKKYLKTKGLSVVKAGYFDAPYWPDFAFSKKELARSFPKIFKACVNKVTVDLHAVEKNIRKAQALEQKLLGWTLPLIAHHQYILAQKI